MQKPKLAEAEQRAEPATPNDWTETTVRVRYAETDQMGVAYHSNYLVWFELGRTNLFRQRGHAYRDLEKEGYYIVVAEVHCRYHAPARYDDLLTIRTRVKEAGRRLVKFEYEIRAEDGGKVASGETMHIITDPDGKPTQLPEQVLTLLKPSSE